MNDKGKNLNLSGRVALIVGGNGGLGKVISEKLSSLDAQVIVHYFSREDEAKIIVKKINDAGFKAKAIQADITTSLEVKKMVTTVVEEFGRIDILINAAGINPIAANVVDYDEDSWEKTIDVNLKGSFLCCKYIAPIMIKKGGGSIINISSILGRNAPPLRVAYSVSKHGLIGLTQTLSKELAPYNITVNAVCPGPIMTAMVEKIFVNTAKEMGITYEEYYDMRQSKIPLKRLGDPEELANVIAFLASDMASYITGAVIDVTGGAIE